MRTMGESRKIAVIVGAGPAGLTAALELIRRTDLRPIVLEAGDEVGGIARTIDCGGFRIDLGGHRFFSKSDWVMQWWQQILPLERASAPDGALSIGYRNQRREVAPSVQRGDADGQSDRVMLVRRRLSRIYFQRKFFDYPVKLNPTTIARLGPWRCIRAAVSYARASVFPRRPEANLEDFLVNRFGVELYRTFFKSYTEKVWGVPCDQISAEWGAQRIKGLSLAAAARHALSRATHLQTGSRRTRTSLVEQFLYPKFGPGQLWQEVARQVVAGGGEIRLSQSVERIRLSGDRVTGVDVRDLSTGTIGTERADYLISSMAVQDLVACLDPAPPPGVRRVASELPYRDFIIVGLLVTRMKIRNRAAAGNGVAYPPDNWIYLQEPGVRAGRLQIFNNWSPAMVADPSRVALGVEYFCGREDELWSLPDAEIEALAVRELQQLDLVDAADVVRSAVIRVPRAYPAYFGAYAEFDMIRAHVDPIANLFLIGRNGMHRYNNQDHSMLTAKAAVDNIAAGRRDKRNIWDINVDDQYHEEAVAQ